MGQDSIKLENGVNEKSSDKQEFVDNGTANSGSDLKANKGDGFKFAVTIIVAFSTAGYNIYEYMQNNPMSEFWTYLLWIFFMPLSFVSVGLIIYMIIKGVSLETNNSFSKDKLDKSSGLVYICTFEVGLFLFCIYGPTRFLLNFSRLAPYTSVDDIDLLLLSLYSIFLLVIWIVLFPKYLRIVLVSIKLSMHFTTLIKLKEELYKIDVNTSKKFFTLIKIMFLYSLPSLVLFIVPVSLLLAFIGEKQSLDIPNTFFYFVLLIEFIYLTFLSFYAWRKLRLKLFEKSLNTDILDNWHLYFGITLIMALSSFIFPYFTLGDITVTMDDVRDSSITHFPIQVVTAGNCGNMTINLTQINVNGNSSLLDSIVVNPTFSSNHIFGKYLQSNSLDYGKYRIFIETTNLTQGYYELSFSEDIQGGRKLLPFKKKTFSSFYLTKSS